MFSTILGTGITWQCNSSRMHQTIKVHIFVATQRPNPTRNTVGNCTCYSGINIEWFGRDVQCYLLVSRRPTTRAYVLAIDTYACLDSILINSRFMHISWNFQLRDSLDYEIIMMNTRGQVGNHLLTVSVSEIDKAVGFTAIKPWITGHPGERVLICIVKWSHFQGETSWPTDSGVQLRPIMRPNQLNCRSVSTQTRTCGYLTSSASATRQINSPISGESPLNILDLEINPPHQFLVPLIERGDVYTMIIILYGGSNDRLGGCSTQLVTESY